MFFKFFTNSLSILPTQYLRREARLVDIGPSHRTSPQNSTLSKFKTLSNSYWGQLPLPFPFTLFGLCVFQIFHKLHFHSKSTLVSRDWGGKQGWRTLDSTIRPHPKTRPLQNSKPFQIHTEDTSLFLILHSFQLWHFSKFRKVHSHSKLDPLSVDHQPTESLGPQEGTIGRV